MKIKLIILYKVGEMNGTQTIFLSVFNVRIIFLMTVYCSCGVFARDRVSKQPILSASNSVMVSNMERYTWRELRDMHFVYGAAEDNDRRAQRTYRERFPQRRCPHYRTFSAIHDRLGSLAH